MVGEGMKQKTYGVGGERATGHLRPAFDRARKAIITAMDKSVNPA